MADAPIAEITRRIDRLERRLALWRRLAFATLAAGCLGLALYLGVSGP